MIYEEVGREMAAAEGGAPRADLGYAEAVPPISEKTTEMSGRISAIAREGPAIASVSPTCLSVLWRRPHLETSIA